MLRIEVTFDFIFSLTFRLQSNHLMFLYFSHPEFIRWLIRFDKPTLLVIVEPKYFKAPAPGTSTSYTEDLSRRGPFQRWIDAAIERSHIEHKQWRKTAVVFQQLCEQHYPVTKKRRFLYGIYQTMSALFTRCHVTDSRALPYKKGLVLEEIDKYSVFQLNMLLSS